MVLFRPVAHLQEMEVALLFKRLRVLLCLLSLACLSILLKPLKTFDSSRAAVSLQTLGNPSSSYSQFTLLFRRSSSSFGSIEVVEEAFLNFMSA